MREDWVWEKQPLRHQGQWRRMGRTPSFAGEEIYLQAVEQKSFRLWSAPCLKEDADCGEEPMQEQLFWQDLWPPRATHIAAVCLQRTATCGKVSPCSSSSGAAAGRNDPCWRSWWRTVSHGRDPMLEQKSMRKKQTQNIMNWSQPFSSALLHHSEEWSGRRVWSEAEPLQEGSNWQASSLSLSWPMCFV